MLVNFDIVIQILLAYFFFFFNFLIVSGIGFILYNLICLIDSKLESLSKFSKLLISFSLGLAIYSFYSYILISFNNYNYIYIILIPIILILLFLIIKRKRLLSNLFTKLRYSNLKGKFKLKNWIICLIFILLFLIIIPRLIESSALLGNDSYLWIRQSLYLITNKTVNYNERSFLYPFGFIFFNSSIFFLMPTFYLKYYFLKFACLPFLTLYILIFYFFLKSIFKKNYIKFLSLIFLISSIYFLYRSLMFLSSAIPVLLILISIIFIRNNRIPKYMLGFTIPIMYLFNPIYFFHFTLLVTGFYFIKFIQERKNKKKVKSLIKELLLICLISLIILVPYFLNTVLVYNGTIPSLFKGFKNNLHFQNFFIDPNKFLLFLPSFNIISLFLIKNINYISIELFYNLFYTITPIFGLIYLFKHRIKKQQADLFIILLIGFIIIFLFNFLFFNIFQSTLKIYYIFERVVEAFIPLLIILMTVFFQSLIKDFQKIQIKFKEFNNIKINKIFHSKQLIIIPIFLCSSTIYLNALNNTRTDYYYDNSIISCVFYLNHNINNEKRIAVQNFNNSNSPYDLLIDYNLFYYSIDYNLSFSEFWTFLNIHQINYIIINLSIYNIAFINSFQSNNSFTNLVGSLNIEKFQLYNLSK